ncbi:MAG: hypothetical protein M3361_08295 [Candidatus Tectomicrobia bacterium]|nr:hypothetical protein [Candidatus Tectomicrobia bacterium]
MTLQQLGLLGAERRRPCHMLRHVGIENARPDPLVRDDRHIKEGIPCPVVAVRLGVDDLAQLAMAGNLRLQFHGVTRFMRAVDHRDAIGGRDKPDVTAFDPD